MRSRFAILVVCVACGGRTGLEDGKPGAPVDDAGQVPTAYKVIYATNGDTIAVWRSTTRESTTLSAGTYVAGLACTYDGHFIAAQRSRGWRVEVLDRDGTSVRVQAGVLRTIRPDGARLIVQEVNGSVEGTLDSDGSFGNVTTENGEDVLDAIEYSRDGKTVLWRHEVPDSVTTRINVSLATALEDGSSVREIVPSSTNSPGIVSGSFSFDGTRVTYLDCSQFYSTITCDLKVVSLDTLKTTTVLESAPIVQARFAPDGHTIVYAEATNLDPGLPNALRSVDTDTGVITTLVEKLDAYSPIRLALCVTRDE